MSTILHPKCGQRFPGGSQAGHCGACCRTFIGLGAFEAHRVGTHTPDTRRCELQAYMTFTRNCEARYGHWQDEKGYWHYGERLTSEQKAKLWPKRQDDGPTITYRAGWWRIYGIDPTETPCFATREQAETYLRSIK